MCNVSLIGTPTGDTEAFNADFEDCNQNTGDIYANLLFASVNNGMYSVSGNATDGSGYSEEILIPNAERINPTKVFKYIAKKLKEVLCPTCM